MLKIIKTTVKNINEMERKVNSFIDELNNEYGIDGYSYIMTPRVSDDNIFMFIEYEKFVMKMRGSLRETN